MVAGSGTLGWDAVAANLVEKGEKAVSPGLVFGLREMLKLRDVGGMICSWS